MRARIAAAFVHAFLVRLTLIALLVGAALPAGWMPNADGLASGIPIVMCTGHGPVAAVIGHAGKPAKPADSRSDICVFAAAAPHATPVVAPALIAPYAEAMAAALPPVPYAVVLAAKYRPQAARAPPLAA